MAAEPDRWKQILRALAVLVLVLVFLSSLEIFSRFFLEGSAVDGPRHMVQVTLPRGASIQQISQILYEKELIEHPRLFRYAVRVMGADRKIQAGTIRLASGQSMVELIRQLTRVKAIGVLVTIREGLTSMDVAGLLSQELAVDSAEFMSVVHDTQVVHEMGIDGPSLEGYLFPDTYIFAEDITPYRIATRMAANFRLHLPDSAEVRAARLDLTVHEAVTLASIIEWEILWHSEARRVSSVYHNRLKRGMLLQADPTVAYALGKSPSRLYYRDLKIDSPYNTYKHPGLPPGPINNPGEVALRAAFNPEPTNYLYFVARGDGYHTFSVKHSDHLAAKRQLDEYRNQESKPDSTDSG